MEIGSGSGEHGVFSGYFSRFIWQTSDPELIHRKSIISWIDHQGLALRMPKPLDIDVEKRLWPISTHLRSLIQGVVCINMIHISSIFVLMPCLKNRKNF